MSDAASTARGVRRTRLGCGALPRVQDGDFVTFPRLVAGKQRTQHVRRGLPANAHASTEEIDEVRGRLVEPLRLPDRGAMYTGARRSGRSGFFASDKRIRGQGVAHARPLSTRRASGRMHPKVVATTLDDDLRLVGTATIRLESRSVLRACRPQWSYSMASRARLMATFCPASECGISSPTDCPEAGSTGQ